MKRPFGRANAREPVRPATVAAGHTLTSFFPGPVKPLGDSRLVAKYDRIKDQISLGKSSASTEEILLRLRQLATDYSYSFSVGISYSFGSIFNTVVNPRFGGSGGLVIF
jgi:hypothetical protein